MSQARTHDADGSGSVRFQLAIQQTRAAVYALGGLIAIVFRRAGILQVSLPAIATVTGLALASVVFFAVVYRKGLGRGWPVRREPLWLACDVALTTAGVYITGGIGSEWFIWYIAIAGAAAFTVGRSGAFRVGVACTASYVLVLAAMGQIRGVDRNLFLALGRMTFLYAASAFFLRGTADLQQRRLVISRLQENESRKVAELTRLTAALDQRTRELAEANVKIREADRLKSQFLANMSHELRTPLNSIIGFSEILSSRLAGQVPEKHLKFLHNINVSGQHLLAIINDILDLSKIEAGRMELHPERFPLFGIISGVCTIMKGVTGARDIALVTDIPEDLPPLEADPVKIKQILYNLIANAVKFSPEHSAVTVRVRRLAAADSPLVQEALQIEVIDQGIGIDPKDRDLIFREFQQADGTSTRRYEGTGLGLALVKKFVDLHGGAVDVHSQVGRGSNFVVLLPVRFKGHGQPAPPPPEPPPPTDSRHRIVVVEDDPTAYETLSRDLAAAGYLPIRARHGEEALSLVRTIHPSAVTLDLVLPGLDGWEILKALKQDSETQDIPVIIVSMIDNRELGFALGARDYFLKPVNTVHLVDRLREIVPSTPPHPRLLLIDDDDAVHAMLEDLLAPLGYRLDHASTGAEGIEKAMRETPSLVLLDLMMQGMDGFEVAARLKSQPRTERLPILVLTAKDLSPEERRRLGGRINALVQKGDGSPSRLVAAIRDLVPPPPAEARRA